MHSCKRRLSHCMRLSHCSHIYGVVFNHIRVYYSQNSGQTAAPKVGLNEFRSCVARIPALVRRNLTPARLLTVFYSFLYPVLLAFYGLLHAPP